ncbi:hypothetical protein JO972_00695 [Verrucomicrobiaceae bacterium 5K15]|uniref:Uncharacterized protein n=1 Tax=Oceaniferula flava TaxID=2800421 RepID=A0AAE2V7C3_9BACT|nr:hypothetical protein [Oceaniferula flavus]MBK1853467.1 hypothetical protein [Oceaniferula flavus]MBM1134772.1 hypothetical protein [Oceaniferula flavus]
MSARGEAAPDSNLAEKADYGPAFQRLVALGLPDSEGASYVKLTLQAQNQHSAQTYYSRQATVPREGNAWVLPEREQKEQGVFTVIHNYSESIQVSQKAKRNGLMRALIGKAKPSKKGGVVGDWSPVDAAKDAEKIIGHLDVLALDGRTFDADRWGYDHSASKLASNVLVIACHMYRAGFTAEGNRMAQKVLTLSPSPTMVIDNVVGDLAEQQYAALAEAFFSNKDWQAYHDGLVALEKRFPRGWRGRLGVKILLPKVEAKINGEQASMAQFKGVRLKPEAVKILDALLARTDPIRVNPRPLWLVAKGNMQAERNYGGEEVAEEWLQKLCAIGMDGFIALAAVAADETLIATHIGESSSSAYSQMQMMRAMMGSSSNSIDVQALTAYNAMRRPCTRGEIARRILISTLPNPDNDLEQKSAEGLRDFAYQWWLEHLADSRSTLARHFMETGDDEQQSIAVQVLISSGNDADSKLVEEFIMSAESLSMSLTMLEPYLKARRGKAKDFYKKYSSSLLDQASGQDESSLPWSIREAGGLEKFLKRLSVYVEEVSPDKILADMRSGKTSLQNGMEMLSAAVGPEGIFKQYPALIEIVAAQKNLAAQTVVLSALTEQVYTAYYEMEESTQAALQQELLEQLPASKEAWGKLLTKTEQPSDSNDQQALRSLPSLAVYAAWSMEAIYYPQHAESLQALHQLLGPQKMAEFILTRAKQLLDDPKTADFPSPDQVTEARRKSIREDLTAFTPLEVANYHQKLTLSEKLAWQEILAAYGDDIPAGVSGLSKMIVEISWARAPDTDAAHQKKLGDLLLNQELNQKLIEQLLNTLSKNAEQNAPYVFMLQMGAGTGTGITLHAWSGLQSHSWKTRIMAEATSKLKEDQATSLAGVSIYENRDWLTGIKFMPAQNDQEEAEQVNKVIKAIVENVKNGSRANIMFFTETASHLKKVSEESSQKRLLPAP